MNRRYLLATLLGAGALGAGLAEAQDLSEEAVAEMLRALGGFEPLPLEPARVRAYLLSVRSTLPPDPEVEPAITFDPRFREPA